MPKEIEKSPASPLRWVLAAIVAGAAALWFVHWTAETSRAPAAEGAVMVEPSNADAGIAAPAAMAVPPRTAALPATREMVIAHVRQAYPILVDVDFGCDAKGCALTATIPPPTGDEYVKKREALLLGGLAAALGTDGYTTLGPIQMDEVDDNKFHIRASVVPRQEPAVQNRQVAR